MPEATARKSRILVVDDDELIRELLKLHLVNAGYEVDVAEDGIAGGRLVLAAPPDLILVDVSMPYMSGYELVRALKADHGTRDIPVIFLSMDESVAEQSKKLGAAAYLTKPVKADRLLDLVGMFARA